VLDALAAAFPESTVRVSSQAGEMSLR
jgi:hypothetical protein